MEFRTEIESKNSDLKIGLKTKIITIGSCFSDVLGSYLFANKLDCNYNPFGIVFNLHSISKLLENTIEINAIEENNIVHSNDVFFHFDYHSEINGQTKKDLIHKISNAHKLSHKILKNSNLLIITLGTSWVYELKKTGEIVSNCHKIPNQEFNKKLLTSDQQLDIFKNIYLRLKSFNSDLKILLTVSPVRHTKDTLELNSVSKSILRFLCHEITQSFEDTFYFPAYEIMMDDLRDYRFYNEDMIHPNVVTEKYIIQKFSERHFDNELKDFLKDWQKIIAAINHRPFNPKTPSHQKFLKDLFLKIEKYKDNIDVSKELVLVKNQII